MACGYLAVLLTTKFKHSLRQYQILETICKFYILWFLIICIW